MRDIKNDIAFYKMSGSGNDFILVDDRKGNLPINDRSAFSRKVCRRRLDVGADGLIVIESSQSADFKWDFYNADGSVAEMCGNGARCAARYAWLIGAVNKPSMCFETLAGLISADVGDDAVTLQMTDPGVPRMAESISVDGNQLSVHCIDTGVPHAVIVVDGLDAVPLSDLGPKVRYHSHFVPKGTNVNFISINDNGSVGIRTYERGVEAETLACGTGAVAGAIVASRLYSLLPPVRMIVKSGLPLDIDFQSENDYQYRNVTLKGEARVVYRGRLEAR